MNKSNRCVSNATVICALCNQPVSPKTQVSPKTHVIANIGSAMADPRKLSLYELPTGELKWLPDATVEYVSN